MRTNSSTVVFAALVAFATLTFAVQHEANAQVRLGAGGGYNVDQDVGVIGFDSWLGIKNVGAQQRLHLSPGFTFQLGGAANWVIDLDLQVLSRTSGFAQLYMGPGVGLRSLESTGRTFDPAINIVYGVLFNPARTIEPFAEGRTRVATTFNGSETSFFFGVVFRPGAGDPERNAE